MTNLPTPEPLPLDVRECLMRGQHSDAVDLLVQACDIDEEQANELITQYKSDLKERNLMLDIQVMNEKLANEGKQRTQLIWLWGVRVAVIIFSLFLSYYLIQLS